MMKSRPAAARVRRTISVAKRMRFSSGAAPFVAALVGARGEELGDQVALRAHDLDAVVARLARERGGAREVVDGLLDLGRRHFARRVRVDRRLERRGRDDALVEAVAPRVQQLQHDAPAGVVHGARNRPMAFARRGVENSARCGPRLPAVVGREAAGDDQRRAARARARRRTPPGARCRRAAPRSRCASSPSGCGWAAWRSPGRAA